ncbi:MAG: hypothetical protein JJE04_26910 [Acidobacteriia bacterium]|nr:hypothetical protein [Terriglobia bacterium]
MSVSKEKYENAQTVLVLGGGDSIRSSLDQAGFKDVSVKQDRDKGVVTLGGHVPAGQDG